MKDNSLLLASDYFVLFAFAFLLSFFGRIPAFRRRSSVRSFGPAWRGARSADGRTETAGEQTKPAKKKEKQARTKTKYL